MIPNLLSKRPLPKAIPKDLEKTVLQLKNCKTKEECLREGYGIITKKYVGKRIETYTQFHHLFTSDPAKLWRRSGFLHCTHQNYLLRLLLVKSGHFADKDIKLKLTAIWGSPHQYLQVRLSEKKIVNVDPWSSALGVPYGKYMHGFA